MTPLDQPLLSIVIPTRNRAQYAIPAIASILSIPSREVELVVQDNSDNDELERYLRSNVNDHRLKYRHEWERIDVIENFNRGTFLATGKYITYLGDDDGVNPELVEAVKWASDNDFDALLPTRPVHYWWPDHRFKYYGDTFAGSLEFSSFSGAVTFPDVEAALLKCVRSAGSDSSGLPKIYYGVVRRDCLEKVKQKAGTYFPGPSPDIAGAVAVASYAKKLCKVDYPLIVPGSSKASTAGLGAQKKHVGSLKDWPHLPSFYVDNWSSLVPAFFSGPTIWGEDVVQALRATGREDMLKHFNLPLLHAKCAVFHPAYLKATVANYFGALKSVGKGAVAGTFLFLYEVLMLWALRFKFLTNRLYRISSNKTEPEFASQKDIQVAIQTLQQYLCKNNLSFASYVESIVFKR